MSLTQNLAATIPTIGVIITLRSLLGNVFRVCSLFFLLKKVKLVQSIFGPLINKRTHKNMIGYNCNNEKRFN